MYDTDKSRKCPRCGCVLMSPAEALGLEGDKKCGHCKADITWEQRWVATIKEEYV